jgi:DNA repair ATPase RecN
LKQIFELRCQISHENENRIHESASLISGATITKSAIESAKELLLAQDLQKG